MHGDTSTFARNGQFIGYVFYGMGSVLLEGPTLVTGLLEKSATCPTLPDGAYPLSVQARSGKDDLATVESPLRIARTIKLSLSSDKPPYKPGQTLHMRLMTLDAELQPAAESVTKIAR